MPEETDPSARIQKQLEEHFFLASRFEIKPPRYLPRARTYAAHAWSRVAKRVGDLIFEHGIETTGHAREVAHYHPDRVWYQPSGWTYLRRVLTKRDVGPQDVFVDLGSGKGRVLLQAAQRYPFARVIGVEISEQLSDAARANVERRGHRLRAPVEIVTADAAAYEVPDDVTVIYLYYPFVGDTFRRVIDNVADSLRRSPRRLRLIYALPTLEDEVIRTGLFRAVRTIRIVSFGVPHRITMYEANLG